MQPDWCFHLARHQNLIMLRVFHKDNFKSCRRGQRLQRGTLITNCLLGFNIMEIYINVLSGTTKNTLLEFLQHGHLSGTRTCNARFYICPPPPSPCPGDVMDDVNVDLCKFMETNTDGTLTSELVCESDGEGFSWQLSLGPFIILFCCLISMLSEYLKSSSETFGFISNIQVSTKILLKNS